MKINARILLILFLIVSLYLGLGVRLFHVQINCHGKYSAMAEGNYSVRSDKVSPRRGRICDRKGSILAINKHTYSIGINYRYSKSDPEMVSVISDSLAIDAKKIKRKIKKRGGFEWLARHVKPEKVERLFKFRNEGVIIVPENSRFYPNSKLASKLIGCVGTDNQGLSGIEYYFDKLLSETENTEKLLRDARGRIVYLSAGEDSNKKVAGEIFLTIDLNIQYIAERELREGFKKYKPNWCMALIQDSSTGEILAMAEYPSFDNNQGVPENVHNLKNKAVSYIFEPGSTFKVVTMAAALEEGIVDEDEKIDCEGGEYVVGGFPIRDFEPHDFLNIEDCMVHSSNIGLAKIGDRLGRKILFKYARDFGFGNFTGIRLPGESRGIFRKPDRWSGTSLSRISFGQEIGVTAVQLVSALSAVANGGMLYEPRIVKKTIVKGVEREFKPLTIRRVIGESTAKKLHKFLNEVVKRGSGVQAQVKGRVVCGKTGTAQKYNPETQSYYENKYVALFGGFVSAADRNLTILVVYDEPQVEYHWGGYVAAPVFSKIAEAMLNYLNVPLSEKI
jgi:cell division protein FtsI (penicillin-binding protein 3)